MSNLTPIEALAAQAVNDLETINGVMMTANKVKKALWDVANEYDAKIKSLEAEIKQKNLIIGSNKKKFDEILEAFDIDGIKEIIEK